MLTAEQIEGVRDFEVRKVTVPEWGEVNGVAPQDAHVYIRTLTADQRDEFISTCIDSRTGSVVRNVQSITARLLAVTVCDSEGTLLFPSFAQAVKVFGERSSAACDRLFGVAIELNALTEEELQKIAADFPETPSADSPTG
jgi:hypothetical protein